MSKKVKIFSLIILATFTFFLIINVVLAEKKISTDSLNIFIEGNKYYKEGKYDKAIESYEKLVNSGYADGVLFYNLGNAYEKMGETGKAIDELFVYLPSVLDDNKTRETLLGNYIAAEDERVIMEPDVSQPITLNRVYTRR